MALIEEVFRHRATGPLERAIKVAVVARAEPVTYTGSDGMEKRSLTVAISDGETVVKCIVYDTTKFTRFVVGATVTLRNIIRKQENGERAFIVTRTSKCFISQNMTISQGHTEAGEAIVNPPPSEKQPIQQALKSPMKQCVSVAGRIVQEEGIRHVNVKGSNVQIKIIVLEDTSGKAKISLWRDASNIEARTGQYVNVTDVVVNHYKGEVSFSTTQKSSVVISEEPLQRREVSVTGICVEDRQTELLLDTDEVLTVSSDLLENSLPEQMQNRDIAQLTIDGAVRLRIDHRGTEIQTIHFLQ